MATNGNGHRRGHNSGMIWMMRTYNSIDRDPEIDVFNAAFRKTRIRESDLAVVAGLVTPTVKRLFDGTTRQPRHSTFAKLAGALGKKYGLIDDKPINYEKEVPKAREQYKEYRAYLAKQREREQHKRG
jgi:hypothetical protein